MYGLQVQDIDPWLTSDSLDREESQWRRRLCEKQEGEGARDGRDREIKMRD